MAGRVTRNRGEHEVCRSGRRGTGNPPFQERQGFLDDRCGVRFFANAGQLRPTRARQEPPPGPCGLNHVPSAVSQKARSFPLAAWPGLATRPAARSTSLRSQVRMAQGSPAGLVYGHVAVHRPGDIGTEGSRVAKHHTHLRSRQPERRGRKTHDYLPPGPFWHALRAACARAGQRPSEQPHGRSCRRTSNREPETPLPVTGEAPEDVRVPDRARCRDLNRLTARGSVST